MVVYVVTDSPDVNWDDNHMYKYRMASADGSPVAQDEVDRRRSAKQPVCLWRWENNQCTLLERYDAESLSSAEIDLGRISSMDIGNSSVFEGAGQRTSLRRRKKREGGLIVTTANEIPGSNVARFLGVARGVVVRAASLGKGIIGDLAKGLPGEVEIFTEVCSEARQDAFERMVEQAQELGADAVIGMRYDSSNICDGVTEVCAYGTAVKLASPSAVTAFHGG
jgi:uncharacterized protein YbjQ (UPF0145 family)